MLDCSLSRQEINNISDSQTVFKELAKHEYRSKAVHHCEKALNRLGSRTGVTLIWIPGRQRSTCLPCQKRGTGFPLVELGTLCGFNKAEINQEMNKHNGFPKSGSGL